MRKKSKVTISDRGASLTFLLHEMSAMQLEEWNHRVLSLFIHDDEELSAGEMLSQGLKLFADKGLGAFGGVDWAKMAPLMEEMLDGCFLLADGPHGSRPLPLTTDVLAEHVEDLGTLLTLRLEILKLNYRFLSRRHLALPPIPGKGNGSQTAELVNMSNVMGSIILRRIATLHELENVYSYTDALNMYELVLVADHNAHASRARQR